MSVTFKAWSQIADGNFAVVFAPTDPRAAMLKVVITDPADGTFHGVANSLADAVAVKVAQVSVLPGGPTALLLAAAQTASAAKSATETTRAAQAATVLPLLDAHTATNAQLQDTVAGIIRFLAAQTQRPPV